MIRLIPSGGYSLKILADGSEAELSVKLIKCRIKRGISSLAAYSPLFCVFSGLD